MPFHTADYTVAIGTVANTDMPALTDDVLTISNGHFLLQQPLDLVWAAAMSATLNRVRIVSPSNRQITLPFIRPVMPTATPPTDPNVADYRQYPFRVNALEELAMEGTSDIAMGTERAHTLIGLQSNFEPTPSGRIYTMRGTSVTASVANSWTTIVTTWADVLPEGSYAVVGLAYNGTTAIAARLIFEDQIFRPGGLGLAAVGDRTHDMFRKGRLGVWGRFRSTALPQVQVLNGGAVSVHTLWMDLMRIG
jgi:hypothetical protein